MNFETLGSKYQGAVASGYEAKRLDRKWVAEQETAEELLRRIPAQSKVLDVPVGTGRLIPILASCGLLITGLDASADMLAEARQCARRSGARVELKQGDIRSIPFPESSFDVVTCLRFLNWIDMQSVGNVLEEVSRVSSDKLLIGVRCLTPTSDMSLSARALIWRGAQFVGLPSRRVRRWGMVLHDKREIENVFEKLQLTVLERRLIERRWDSTDYVFYFLEKLKTDTASLRIDATRSRVLASNGTV